MGESAICTYLVGKEAVSRETSSPHGTKCKPLFCKYRKGNVVNKLPRTHTLAKGHVTPADSQKVALGFDGFVLRSTGVMCTMIAKI